MKTHEESFLKRIFSVILVAMIVFSTSSVFGINLLPINPDPVGGDTFIYTGHTQYEQAGFVLGKEDGNSTGIFSIGHIVGETTTDEALHGMCLNFDQYLSEGVAYSQYSLEEKYGESKAVRIRAIVNELYPTMGGSLMVDGINGKLSTAYNADELVLAAQQAIWKVVQNYDMDIDYVNNRMLKHFNRVVDLKPAYDYFLGLPGVPAPYLEPAQVDMSQVSGQIIGDDIQLVFTYVITGKNFDGTPVVGEVRTNLGEIQAVQTELETGRQQVKITMPLVLYKSRLENKDFKVEIIARQSAHDLFVLLDERDVTEKSQALVLLDYMKKISVKATRSYALETLTSSTQSTTAVQTTRTVRTNPPDDEPVPTTTTTSATITTTTTAATTIETTTAIPTTIVELTEAPVPQGGLDENGDTIILDSEVPLDALVLPKTSEGSIRIFLLIGFSLMSIGLLIRLSRS